MKRRTNGNHSPVWIELGLDVIRDVSLHPNASGRISHAALGVGAHLQFLVEDHSEELLYGINVIGTFLMDGGTFRIR